MGVKTGRQEVDVTCDKCDAECEWDESLIKMVNDRGDENLICLKCFKKLIDDTAKL